MLIVFIGFASGFNDDWFGALLLTALPFIVAFAIAVVALACVALPLTYWLRSSGGESRNAYLTAGLIAGGLFVVLGGAAVGMPFGTIMLLGVFAMLTGGVTGHFWWRFVRRSEVEGGDVPFDEIQKVFD